MCVCVFERLKPLESESCRFGGMHPSRSLHLSVASLGSTLDQPAQGEVIDDVLDPLDVVLYGVGPLAQDVVLEVEQLEAGKEVPDEGADDGGELKVAEGDGVCGEAGEVRGQLGEGEEVLLEGEVEGVPVLEVGRDAEDDAELVEGEEAAEGGGLRLVSLSAFST